jgi:hypothetical protein
MDVNETGSHDFVISLQDYDQCRDACARFDCKGVNVFQVGEYEFVCEILAYVDGVVRAEGAACYLGQ